MSTQSTVWTKAQGVIELATKLTIIGVPALYFMGWIYLETYWKGFGLGETLLGFDAADYLRSGTYVLMMSIVSGTPWVATFAWLCIAMLALLIAARFFAVRWLFALGMQFRDWAVSVRKRARRAAPPKYGRAARAVENLFESLGAGVASLLATFLLLIGIILVGINPSKSLAEEDFQKERSALATFATLERDWVVGHVDPLIGRPSLILQCGSETCVVLTGEQVEVLPRSSITRMEACRRVNRSDDGVFRCLTRNAIATDPRK